MGTGLEFFALAAVSTAAAVASAQEQEKAGDAAHQRMLAEQRKAEVENTFKVRQAVRQARIAQASMLNQAALAGGMGSSGLAGGLSSVGSQLAGNLSFMSDIADENTAIMSAMGQEAKRMGKAQVYGQVGQLAGTIFSGMTGMSPGQYVGSQLKPNRAPITTATVNYTGRP
jgi:hypothetical protein